MNVEIIQGTHSDRDTILLVTANKEAIKLEDVFGLISLFTSNELRRIRVDSVREEICKGERPFMFQDKINELIHNLKEEELNLIKLKEEKNNGNTNMA